MKQANVLFTLVFSLFICIINAYATPIYHSIEANQNGFIVNGQYMLLRGGTIQWFRIPTEEWEDRIKRFKAAGFNTIDMYVGWNIHEPKEGEFQFNNPDIRGFLDLVKKHGLFIYFRPGPYICNEYDGGGFPAWLFKQSTKKNKDADGKPNLRTDDPDYLAYVERFFNRLNEVIRPYLITNGGPIILYAIENEYNWFETFFNIDKAFELGGDSIFSWYDMERGTNQSTGTTAYFNALKQYLLADGINIPLATCPGDSKVSAMGDANNGWASQIIPIPNFYILDNAEKLSRELLDSMHNTDQFEGHYVNYPSGTTETFRSASRMKQMFLAGLDAFFAFNIVGMNQEGYLNTIVLDPAATSNLLNLFEVNWSNANNLFVAPGYGYFHGVVDYYGAISASGAHREKYYHFRRNNLFFNDFENMLGGVLHTCRTGDIDNADPRVSITSDQAGIIEDNKRVHYFLDTGNDTFFISLLNHTPEPFDIGESKIRVNDMFFPKYTQLTVPIEFVPVNPNDFGPNINDINTCDRDYTMILVTNLKIFSDLVMTYTTSEILTFRNFNGSPLLVLFGPEGKQGEIELKGAQEKPIIVSQNESIQSVETNNTKLSLIYDYQPFATALIQTHEGNIVRVIVTTIKEAGRFWFIKHKDTDCLLTSFDYLETQETETSLLLTYESRKDMADIVLVSPQKLTISGLEIASPFDSNLQTTIYLAPQWIDPPDISNCLATGKIHSDQEETDVSYNDQAWISWTGEPKYLEQNDIYSGHAWYRTTFELSSIPNDSKLYVKSASDIVGIYVNGTYLTTVCPIGTEIDNYSQNVYYQFENLKPYLTAGKNVIAFRTEIWGHGSFMFPRGKLLYTSIRLPALGVDAMKGLSGEAKAADKKLENWSVRAGLGGAIKGYQQPGFNDSDWETAAIPFQLNPGEIRWYRTSFKTSDVLDSQHFHAPVVLALDGENTKGTIYLNGRLIGRWLSKGKYPEGELIPENEEWLRKGTWGRPTRELWNCTNPNHFPLSPGILKPNNEKNVLAIAFEDTSPERRVRGKIHSLTIIYNEEEKKNTGTNTINIQNVRNRGNLSIHQTNITDKRIGLDDVIILLRKLSEF